MERLVRLSLWVTAPFNLAAGAVFAWPASALGQMLTLPVDVPAFYALFSGGMIFLFGLVYAWLALQRPLVRPLLCVGACGKLMAVTITTALYLSGSVSGLFATFLAGDLVFVILWFVYLTQSADEEAT